MKRVGLFYGDFDPATVKTVEYAAAQIKSKKLHEVWFVVSEGVNLRERIAILKMIASRRKFRIYTQISLKDRRYEFIDITDQTLEVKELQFSDLKLLTGRQKRYMTAHGLYLESISKSVLKEKRWEHVRRVARLCSAFAIGNHLDPEKAYVSGILHDIAKEMKEEELKPVMDVYYPQHEHYNYHVWHQYVGAVMLERDLKCRDKKIIRAVKHHCLGDDKDPYSMMLYCADKLDPGREYDSSREIALCQQNIEEGYRTVMQQQQEYLRKEEVI